MSSLLFFWCATMTTVARRPASLTIFLADGVPDGLRTVDKSGWIGHFIVCPRGRFPEARTSQEFARTGVYILCGPSDDSDLPIVYVGEGDPTRPRLEQHYRQKDFWTSLILFTANNQLNKAHVQYLESRLVSMARAAKRCVLDNSNDPQLPTLAIADTAAMEGFLEEMLPIFPLLGLTVFEVPSQPPRPVTGKPSPGTQPGPPDTTLYLKARGIKASGYDRSEGFVVLAGSEAVGDKKCVKNMPPSALNVRNSLVKQGVLVPDADHFKFTQDYSLNSPSQAAAVVMGCSANGLKEWKDAQGHHLKVIRVALPDDKVKPIKPTVPSLPLLPSSALPPTTPASGGQHVAAHQARFAQATVLHGAAMQVLSQGGTLPQGQKIALSKSLSVMNKRQLKSLYAALGGTAAITGAQRQPWVHAIKSILTGSTPTSPPPAPATPAAPSSAVG